MPGRDVGRPAAEQAVKAAEHIKVDRAEGGARRVMQERQVGHPFGWEEQDLIRPAGRGRDESGPVVVARHHPRARSELTRNQIAEQVASCALGVPPCLVKQPGRARRHEGIAVDLPMRVMEGHADFLTAVLEAEHLLDTVECGQCGGPVRPRLDDGAHPGGRELGEGGIVVGRETDDFASAVARTPREQVRLRSACRLRRGWMLPRLRSRQRGETVLEDHDVVAARGDFGGPPGPGRVERARVRCRQEGTVLALLGDHHPFPGKRIPPQHGRGTICRIAQVTGVPDGLSAEPGRFVEVDDLAPVGEPRRVFPYLVGVHRIHTLLARPRDPASWPCDL